MKHCKNCGRELHDSFCSHCGQHTKTERITFSYLCHELVHLFTHIEKGFLFTSLRMIRFPGKTVKDFIEGRRKNYQPPISYFLIWITIYILFLFWIEKVFGENKVINYKEYFGPAITTKFAITHLSIVLTAVIPFQALYLYLLVTKKTYNYFETMVATIYSLGTVILVFAVIALLIHTVSPAPLDLRISDLLKVLYLVWFTFNLVKLFPVNLKFIRALAFIILAFGTFTLWRLYGFPEIVSWFHLKK